MNTSIVIPLGTGSRWGNRELKFALRSVEKHLSGYGDVFIIGEYPSWLQNCVHIQATDLTQSYDKERNIFAKIMLACNDDRVTDNFLFMNDDHFLLQDYEAGEFPYYCSGFLSHQTTRVDLYGNTAQNTAEYFKIGDVPYFDVHSPIVYNKSTFKEIPWPDWNKKWGYCIKTIYANWVMPSNVIAMHDLKINEQYPAVLIKQFIVGRAWFSMGDKAREGGMLQVLEELYPEPSIYERIKKYI